MVNQTFWHERIGAARKCPCLFLDRDGVIVEEVNYLHRREDVRLLPGIRELVLRAKAAGFAIGMVSNQAGVARGYFDWSAFAVVLAEIVALMGCGDEVFDFVAACGAHPDGVVEGLRVAGHSWRKPMPGMLMAAGACLEFDLASSIMVGDQLSDVQAADAAGIAHVFHVRTGHGASQRAAAADHRLRSGGTLHLVDGLDEVGIRLGWQDEGGNHGHRS